MHKNRCFLVIGFVCAVFYIGALSYFSHFYNEKRWIPKVVLELPILTEHQSSMKSIGPDVLPEKEDAPFQVLFDTTPLPNIGMVRPWSDETNALQTYAKPFWDEHLPKISIVLTQVGLNAELFAQAVQKLPSAITLSFSPYVLDLPEKIKYARQNGFENMLDIPVESSTAFTNGGKYALKPNFDITDASELIQNHYLAENIPFIGFYLNEAVPFDEKIWDLVSLQNIAPYGLTTLFAETADFVYQDDFYQSAIENALETAEQIAIKKGHYILVLPMHPKVVDVLVEWIGLQFHPNVSFVPFSMLKGVNYE